MDSHPPSSNPKPEQPTTQPRERLWNHTIMAWGYRWLVIGGTYRLLWGCPWPLVDQLYATTVQPGTCHLEIGPGNGFFLDRLPLSGTEVDLHLLDLHQGPLQASAARLARFTPTMHTHDALSPFPVASDAADSVAMSMVLHCLRGHDIAAKAVVFDHVAEVLRPGGVFFGATVLAQGVTLSRPGRAGLRLLNNKEVFCNTGDSLSGLRQALLERFDQVDLRVQGAVALWSAKGRDQ